MTTVFVPKIGTITETREVTTKGVVNLPAAGTRIRATLGGSVLVGTITDKNSRFELVEIELDGFAKHYQNMAQFDLWVGAGWAFEILDDQAVFA